MHSMDVHINACMHSSTDAKTLWCEHVDKCLTERKSAMRVGWISR